MLSLPYIEEYYLANGLQVVLMPRSGAGSVKTMLGYRVGAKHETPPYTGLAHLFEHLMFKGTAEVPDYSALIERLGGRDNAYTNEDVTVYYNIVPKGCLEPALAVEADRIYNLALKPEEVSTEKSVVVEEFRQNYLSRPFGDFAFHLRANVFGTRPYSWMTIGQHPEQIYDIPLATINEFYHTYYQPRNAVLVVAGGLDVDEAKLMIDKYFGILDNISPLPEFDYPASGDKVFKDKQILLGSWPYNQYYWAFKAPGYLNFDSNYISWLDSLMGDCENNILEAKLEREMNLVQQISSFYWPLFNSGLYLLAAMPSAGVSYSEIESVILDLLSNLSSVSEFDLNLAKEHHLNSIARMISNYGQLSDGLMRLALAGRLNEWSSFFEDFKHLETDKLITSGQDLTSDFSRLFYITN